MSLPSRFLTSGVIMNDVVVNTATTTNSEILDISHAKHIGLDVFINNTGMDGNIEVEVCLVAPLHLDNCFHHSFLRYQ